MMGPGQVIPGISVKLDKDITMTMIGRVAQGRGRTNKTCQGDCKEQACVPTLVDPALSMSCPVECIDLRETCC